MSINATTANVQTMMGPTLIVTRLITTVIQGIGGVMKPLVQARGAVDLKTTTIVWTRKPVTVIPIPV